MEVETLEKSNRVVVQESSPPFLSAGNSQTAPKRQPRSLSQAYVFVLWNEQFEEIASVIFIRQLRNAGLRVKLVGLTHQPASGINGLALVPDLTLDQALLLADYAVCMIIPCTWLSLRRLENDPRLCEFFNQVRSNQARFVVGSLGEECELNGNLLSIVTDIVMVYPDYEDLVEFARKLADSLLKAIRSID
jgi:hypothetical protein